MQLAFLTGRHRSTIWKVLRRHGVSQVRRSERPQTTRRYEWTEAGALLHIDAFELPKFDGPAATRGPTPTSATAPCHRSSATTTAADLTQPEAAERRSPPFSTSAGRTSSPLSGAISPLVDAAQPTL
jgi:hypothetical protein